MNKEAFVYLMIAASSLLMVSFLPHMFLEGYVEENTITKIQIGVTIVWGVGLFFVGMDIVKKRRGLK